MISFGLCYRCDAASSVQVGVRTRAPCYRRGSGIAADGSEVGKQDACHRIARHGASRHKYRHTKFTKVWSFGLMRQPVKRQAVKR